MIILIVLVWAYYLMYVMELFSDYISPIETKKQAFIYLIPFSMWIVLIFKLKLK